MKKVVFSFSIIATAVLYFSMRQPLCGRGSRIDTATISVRESMKSGLFMFNLRVGRYPTTEEGLAALLKAPNGIEGLWRGPYIEGGKIPRDPWGREYQYRCPGQKNAAAYDLWSLGPDGVPSADDIGNWQN